MPHYSKKSKPLSPPCPRVDDTDNSEAESATRQGSFGLTLEDFYTFLVQQHNEGQTS